MPDVTCPNCWLWQPLGRSTRCRACGVPLISSTGIRVDQAWAPPARAEGPAAGTMASVGPPPYAPTIPWVPAGYGGAAAAQPARGVDWVLWVRIGIAVPAALAALGLLFLGLALRHITLPATAGSAAQTYDIAGPAVVMAIVLLLAVTALIVWLAQFAVARGLLVALTLVNVLSILSQLSAASPAYRIAYFVDLGWDIAFGALLCLSLAAIPRRTR